MPTETRQKHKSTIKYNSLNRNATNIKHNEWAHGLSLLLFIALESTKHCTLWVCHLCKERPVVPGPPSWRRPGGPEHRSADSGCSACGAPSAAAPCRRRGAASGTTKPPRCARTPAPNRCRRYLPGSNGRPPPGRDRGRGGDLSQITHKGTDSTFPFQLPGILQSGRDLREVGFKVARHFGSSNFMVDGSSLMKHNTSSFTVWL